MKSDVDIFTDPVMSGSPGSIGVITEAE